MLSVTAARNGDTLTLGVLNDGQLLPKQILEGVGISNTRERACAVWRCIVVDAAKYCQRRARHDYPSLSRKLMEGPLRALIIDDEPLARSNLAVLLARDPAITLVGQCGSAEEALAALTAAKPDLVFLDVEMPECDGFELLDRIGPAPAFAIVFVTAHHQFALRAFEVGALDYLLKPFDDQRFERVLERVKERLNVPSETRRFYHQARQHAGGGEICRDRLDRSQ